MGIRYNHYYEAFGRIVLCEMMLPEVLKRAERVKARAEATAPYDAKSKDGTHYRDSFKAEAFIGPTGRGGIRAIGRVSNSDDAALFVEYGTKNNPRHRTLGNALDAAGD